MVDQKQPQNVEYLNYLGIMVTNDARCTRDIKSGIATANAEFNKKKTFFKSKLDLNSRKGLLNFSIWSTLLNGVRNRTLCQVHKKYLKVLKCGAVEGWRRSVEPIM